MGKSEWPPMAACLLTATRTEYAVRTVKSISEKLQYPNLAWYIAGDGSDKAHMGAVQKALDEAGATVFGSHSQKMGPGPSWNLAIKEALARCKLVFWVENDWELRNELDVTRYVKLLMEKPEVGMMRLSYMAIGLNLFSVGHDGTHYLRMEKSTPYAYSGNPSIRHRRYFDAYRWYPNYQANPGECEVWHDNEFRSKDGPEIWWPMDLPDCGWGGGFGHIGQEQSY